MSEGDGSVVRRQIYFEIGEMDTAWLFYVVFFINRDVPDELPVWIGANEAKKGCVISQVGDNVFAAVK